MSNKLKAQIVLQGYTLPEFAEKHNIGYHTLLRKIAGLSKLTIEDVRFFEGSLNLTPREVIDIFFPDWLQKMQQG